MRLLDDTVLDSTLKERFGFESFRPGQRQAIRELLDHGSLLCIHPTGFGKSLLYQLPAILLDGITLVISPLLALVRDQQNHLNNRFGITAAAINSDQTDDENAFVRTQTLNGLTRILFVAPEQLDNPDRFDFLRNLPVSLLVIDEAHCISTWGHDFRPSYRQIIQLVHAQQQRNPNIRVLGLTATADARTEADIQQQLSVPGKELTVLRESMDRPNISLSVLQVSTVPGKLVACEQLLSRLEGSGLIYCATRENSELVGSYLQMRGLSAASYHAGFESDQKRQLQHDFLANKYRVMAATNALGMGIDKSDLRFVIHFDIPGSITAYYQEVGRSGRDGSKAQGVLLYDPEDRRIQKYFIESAQPSVEEFTRVLEAVSTAAETPNLSYIKRFTGLHPTKVTVILAELVEQAFLTKESRSSAVVYVLTNRKGAPDMSRYGRQREVKMRELDTMVRYAEGREECRMEMLRRALGDAHTNPCGHCCACDPSKAAYQQDAEAVSVVASWINRQAVPIAPSKILNVSEGMSLLDSKIRSPAFVHFMRQRAVADAPDLGMTEDLWDLLHTQLDKISRQHPISAVLALPSRTWVARDGIAKAIGEQLRVPFFTDLLYWKEEPASRQGQLLNNDQRQHNVRGLMSLRGAFSPGRGAILLLDDYIGSGATVKEAARVLRKDLRLTLPIVPLTIAVVKWRLGSPGFV